MNRSATSAILIGASLLLSACATTTGTPTAAADLLRGAPCCSDPAQFPFRDLASNASVDVTIGADSPLFEFQSGPSRFEAFRLPESLQAGKLKVKAKFEGTTRDGRVFYPLVAMLDEGFLVSRVSSLENLRLEQALATPGGESGIAVTVPLDSRLARERYVVVFTPAVLFDAQPETRRDGDVVTQAAAAWIERRGDSVVPPAAGGRISIALVEGTP